MPRLQSKGFGLTTKLSEKPETGTTTSDPIRDKTPRNHQRPDTETRLTVIIPTKDRTADLRRTVASLLRQTRLPDELVIVDQSKNGDGAEVVSRLFAAPAAGAADCSTELTYVRDPGISGGSQARNRGIELAQGDVWLFLDDDVELERDFVRELMLAYKENPAVAGISGVVTNYRPLPWQSRLWSSLFLRGPFRDDRQPVYQRADSRTKAGPVRVSRLGGGLMSFRAAAVGRTRFDENLTGVCDGEDVDFCMQMGPHAQLLITPRARLVHNQSPAGRATDHWLRRFTQANYYLYHRNWRQGVANRISFLWLNVGLALTATAGSLRRLSRVPWAALLEGVRAGHRSAVGPRDQCASQ